jgi:tetratricopeptide (TPR) repeat protein
MIVDNADDLAVFFHLNGSQTSTDQNTVQVTRPLSDFLPQSPNGSILVTSRSRNVAYRLVGRDPDIIKVKPMGREHALSLLYIKLPESRDTTDSAELVRTLDYMPLAITQAAAYICQREPHITVSKYLHNLRGDDKDRTNLLKKDVGDTRRDGTASNSIIVTWQISFEHIRKERSSAARLLSLMSLFDRQGIPEALLLQNYQDNNDIEANFEDDLSTLTSYSLVTMNVEGDEFEMHRLVQFSTKKWLELYNELENWKEKYIVIMENAFPVGWYENWTICGKLFPHAQMVLLLCPTNEVHLVQWASILYNAAWYSWETGSYNIAEEMNHRALEGFEKALGKEHPNTLKSINNLALVLRDQGKYKQAEEMNRQAMIGYKKALGKEHPDTLASMNNLALTLGNQGRWKDAEELGVQELKICKRVLGEEHPNTLISINNLVVTFWNQGRWKEAEELGVQVLKICKRVLGEEHPNTLISINNLALTFSSQGRWKEAKELGEQVVEMSKRVLGEEHPNTLIYTSNLVIYTAA